MNNAMVRLSLLGFMVAILSLSGGCRQYPPVTSRESLDTIKEVYTACNTKNLSRVSRCEEKISTLVQEGKMDSAEAGHFRDILDLAKQSRWEEAQTQALRYAKDQVR